LKKILGIVILLLNLTAVAQASELIEILAPDKRISVKCDNIHIIGKTGAPIVDIFLNGKFIDNTKVKEGYFHKQISFGYGLHEIKFVPIFSGKPESETEFVTVEVMYAPTIDRKYKRLYPDYIFHNQSQRQECLTCHKCDCDDLNDIDDEATCLECHASLTSNFSKHIETENRICIICHELGADLKQLLSANRSLDNPCLKCHKDRIKSFDQKYVHGPVAGGSCTICHDQHGSPYEKDLKAPLNVLCVSCHNEIENQMREMVVHQPFIEGQCGGCHDPHSTNNEWVLKKSSEEICLGCHDPKSTLKNHKHPFNVKPKNKLAVDLELTPEGRLECLSCHNPHSSRQQFMLKMETESICVGCHKDK